MLLSGTDSFLLEYSTADSLSEGRQNNFDIVTSNCDSGGMDTLTRNITVTPGGMDTLSREITVRIVTSGGMDTLFREITVRIGTPVEWIH